MINLSFGIIFLKILSNRNGLKSINNPISNQILSMSVSISAQASTVINLPIDKVWSRIRDFTFPEKLLSKFIESCQMENNKSSHEVGALRIMKWKTGEVRKDRLLALDDQYYRIAWELEEGEHVEVSAKISQITLKRITDTNSTLISWSADYSADVKGEFVLYEQKSFGECLEEIKKSLQ